jgi:hypothetical protein
MEYIYILKLKNNKYYIGKTFNVDNRYEQHLNGIGSSWTKKYKPLSILKKILSTSPFDEDKYVKEYMSKYGIDNVRGGSYTSIELDEISLLTLQKELWHSKNLCTRCGRNTHFAKDCYAKTDIDGNLIDNDKSLYYTETESSSPSSSSSSSYQEVWCCSYCNKEYDSENGARFHENFYCKNKYKTNKQKYYNNKSCGICGKKGHREVNCNFF